MLDTFLLSRDRFEDIAFSASTSGTIVYPALSRLEEYRRRLVDIIGSSNTDSMSMETAKEGIAKDIFRLHAAEFDSLSLPSHIDYPKTELAKELFKIRNRIIASGERLLDWDELKKEIAARRGEED